jgi:AGCS family alanine or glycine:cation symporter
MEKLANLIWDPFLCLFYLVVGALFAWFLRGEAWRGLGSAVRAATRASSADEEGISHRDGFLAALGATVGVGNLAGVATALHLGGPGALFWMWVSAVLGMHFRLASTYLAIKYQPPRSDPGFATPMIYFDRFLPPSWRFLAKVLAALLVGVGFINANLIQSNSVAQALTHLFDVPTAVVASTLAVVVGLVILAGLQSIVRLSVRLTPFMIVAYLGLGVTVLAMDPAAALSGLRSVFDAALSPRSVLGGAAGATVFASLRYGVSRGIFSHGCGMATAPFFQANNGDHPARGALLAAAVPAFDVLVCTVTGLVILSGGDWLVSTSAYLTVASFESAAGIGGRTIVLACLAVFAFTTVISWAHFAERCYQYLGGSRITAFRLVFAGVTLLGPFFPVQLVWSLGDILVGLLLMVHLLPLTLASIGAQRHMARDLRAIAHD